MIFCTIDSGRQISSQLSVSDFLLGFFQRSVEMMCIPKELGEKKFQPIYLPEHIFETSGFTTNYLVTSYNWYPQAHLVWTRFTGI